MKDLFYQGGSMFMGILTLLLLAIIVWNVYHFIVYSKSTKAMLPVLQRKFRNGRDIGLFAVIVGITGQMIGLFVAFDYIQKVEDVRPSLVWAGLKVSMIPTLYGMFIFLFALLVWFVANSMVERKM